MSSTEEPSGTVLHRLIQEQLRYGNPTDTRTLLAIQQQALRGGSGSGPSSGGDMGRSPRSSLESLTQEDPPFPQLSARQEPQGQEYQGDYHHSESGYQLYQLHGEELPTYEQAKVHSQYLASHWAPTGPASQLHDGLLHEGAFHEEADLMELKCGHVRSLSEHCMQISLERNDAAKLEAIKSTSHSYPELAYYMPQGLQSTRQSMDKRTPPPEYSAPIQGHGFIPHQVQEPVQAQQHRYVQSGLPAELPCYSTFTGLPPAGLEEPNQVELLLMENERLRQELEAHREKTGRIQKFQRETLQSYLAADQPDIILQPPHLSMKPNPGQQLSPQRPTPGTLPHLDGTDEISSCYLPYHRGTNRGHSLLLCLHTPFIVELTLWRPGCVCVRVCVCVLVPRRP